MHGLLLPSCGAFVVEKRIDYQIWDREENWYRRRRAMPAWRNVGRHPPGFRDKCAATGSSAASAVEFEASFDRLGEVGVWQKQNLTGAASAGRMEERVLHLFHRIDAFDLDVDGTVRD